MQPNPYLLFNGQCVAAFKFYAQVLGGKIDHGMPRNHAKTHGQEVFWSGICMLPSSAKA